MFDNAYKEHYKYTDISSEIFPRNPRAYVLLPVGQKPGENKLSCKDFTGYLHDFQSFCLAISTNLDTKKIATPSLQI